MRIAYRDAPEKKQVCWDDLRFGEVFWWGDDLYLKVDSKANEVNDYKRIVRLENGKEACIYPTLTQFRRVDAHVIAYDQPKRTAE